MFAAAAALQGGERSAYLDSACRNDSELRAEVESLLSAHAGAEAFGRTPFPDATTARGASPRRLSPGTQLGPYRIESWVGAGGMGEVYRALDTKLGRPVAIKVLPDSLAHEPARRSRFEHEARALAALNHPYIGAIYGLDESGDVAALVLEFVDGPTLDERLARGPLSIAEVRHIAVQLAEALEAAHDNGIVHRDLKPANIKITPSGNVKVLDFGLAKAIGAPGAAEPDTPHRVSPTAVTATQQGMIVGTPAYMSPEQARGEPIDKRTDIWAFGCVVFEMCAGRAPFTGNSVADTLAAVIEREPGWAALRPSTPPHLVRLLRRCLTKDPKLRLRDIGEARIALLDDAGDDSAEAAARAAVTLRSRSRRRMGMAIGAAAVLGLLALGFSWMALRPRPSTTPPVRFLVFPPPSGHFVRHMARTFLALSPDGSQLAFVGGVDYSQLWLRAMSDVEARAVPGTEGANSVFWSPDGRSLAFTTANALKRVDLAGGAAVTLTQVPAGNLMHGTWGSRGTILLGLGPGTAIYSVPAAGGELREVIVPDRSKGEVRAHWPWFLPDGNRFLYTARYASGEGELRLAELDDGAARPILRASSNAQWIDPDTVVFAREGVLMGQRMNLASARPIGEPFVIAQPVDYFYTSSRAMFSAARNGAVAHHAGGDREQLLWVDQQGGQIDTLGSPADYDLQSFRFSRDGTMLLSARRQKELGTWDLWRLDLARRTEERLTADRGSEVTPALIDGGRAIVFAADREAAVPQLSRKDLATGGEQPLVSTGLQHLVMDLFPEDRAVAYLERNENGNWDIFQLPLAPGASPAPLLQSRVDKPEMRLSPDGRAMAFVTMEGSEWDLHVVPIPVAGHSVVVAAAVKSSARWSADGRRLYYVGADTTMMATDVRTTPSLSVGMPQELFELDPRWLFVDVSPDGRLLMSAVQVSGREQPIVVTTAALGGGGS